MIITVNNIDNLINSINPLNTSDVIVKYYPTNSWIGGFIKKQKSTDTVIYF